jgi:hypothetical protein
MSQPWTHTPYSPAHPRVDEHYVEPFWVSERLFDEEKFTGKVYDPCCGFGRIVISGLQAGIDTYGSDIAYRGWDSTLQDFLKHRARHDNLVFNPPFNMFREFTEHAVRCARHKVAAIMPTARLNAAGWMRRLPLRRIWLLTPRPSMPPGSVITNGGKVGGGKSDYCWIVFEDGYGGLPETNWLHRDKL